MIVVARKQKEIKETQTIIRTIKDSQPQLETGIEGIAADDIVYDLAENIINSILKQISMEDVNIYLFKRDDKNRLPSLTTVLIQEVNRYNKLLKLIHSSMVNLKKAIKGLVVMSESLESVFKALTNNQVPDVWTKRAYNSLKSLGSWIKDLALRLDFITIWARSGYPTSYWISGFYFPQGFLTGTLQTYARKYNLPIDKLKFDFTVHPVNLDQEEIKIAHDIEGKELSFTVTSFIEYTDEKEAQVPYATNLYAHSMSQYLPVGDFTWLSKDEIKNLDIMSISQYSDYGYVFEVDIPKIQKIYMINTTNSHF
ncbi:dynein heavy chain 6, axonemal-like [Sitophilus oryzae]|uniref:Dynein heavy chain 6, axonemal-like n=1 Tax=Sitophilus oryzae TaxID=7048 RepID=A0A6J2Y3N9_SITOR|nr:dynein heavy chain 6, axonemal-like [Sitophilus oryzae]